MPVGTRDWDEGLIRIEVCVDLAIGVGKGRSRRARNAARVIGVRHSLCVPRGGRLAHLLHYVVGVCLRESGHVCHQHLCHVLAPVDVVIEEDELELFPRRVLHVALGLCRSERRVERVRDFDGRLGERGDKRGAERGQNEDRDAEDR